MNIARAHRSSPDLWDRYARLPAGPKMVLRLKSLVFLPTGKTVFLECLNARAGLRGVTPYPSRAWPLAASTTSSTQSSATKARLISPACAHVDLRSVRCIVTPTTVASER